MSSMIAAVTGLGAFSATAAIGTVSAAASLYGLSQTASATRDAANTQARSAQTGIDAQTTANSDLKALLAPYTSAGYQSLAHQQDLLGLNGNDAQLGAINSIKQSSQFDQLNRTGQDAILQNASATGGLRGGNTQAALAQFSPALLNSLISDQYTKLGGMTSIGSNAAAGTGNAGMQSANSVSALLAQQGRANAGGILGQAGAINSGINTGFNLLGRGWGGLNSNGSSGNNNVWGLEQYGAGGDGTYGLNSDITQGW
jgi:hypothetical protein